MLTHEKLKQLRALSKAADIEMEEKKFAPSLILYEEELFNCAPDLIDAAELVIAPTNVAASRFIDAVERVKILERKIKDLEDENSLLKRNCRLAES